DCAYALLIFELWLPNIASTIKIQLFAGMLASLAPERKEPVLLSDYSKFCDFCSSLVASSPTFTLLEDYIPEADWGEVKFPFEESLYKIFYGGVVERICDFLSAFRINFGSCANDYKNVIARNP